MEVRGAPLIGITAAFGAAFAVQEAKRLEGSTHEWQTAMGHLIAQLRAARPTAVNLHWAIEQQLAYMATRQDDEKLALELFEHAIVLMDEDRETCRRIGTHGLGLMRQIAERKNGEPVNILTHCNAGSLAVVAWGTATAPIYLAHLEGLPIHVWVDETRPRNQGANLTAYELGLAGVPHTLIADNTGGHLMQQGLVDLCLVGCDRVTARGDVANKVGTYLKALSANDNGIPFYVCLPSSTIDWGIQDGLAEIPIETRSPQEVRYVRGMVNGQWQDVLICPPDTPALNIGFDVTPARLITGLITERGICQANKEGLRSLFGEMQDVDV
jgi:methylthioribose-1-phosphate isomerase